jgi:hypothetical protein
VYRRIAVQAATAATGLLTDQEFAHRLNTDIVEMGSIRTAGFYLTNARSEQAVHTACPLTPQADDVGEFPVPSSSSTIASHSASAESNPIAQTEFRFRVHRGASAPRR